MADMREWARRGAGHRLAEIRAEEADIVRKFPELKIRHRAPAAVAEAAPVKRKRRKMSAAVRKAISERMKKSWVARKALAAKRK